MSLIDRLAWRSITKWLERYCRRQSGLRHCFIRHSTASGPQHLLVADYDLAFFVEAADFDDVRNHLIRIRRDLKKARILDAIVLPATESAYRLCAGHYAHRSLYPMRNWRCLFGEPLPLPHTPYRPPPLDHSPEGFLYGYLVPVMQGTARRHPFERLLLRRKLEREQSQFAAHPRQTPPNEFYEVVADQIRAWDLFFGELDFTPHDQRISAPPIPNELCQSFQEQWTRAALPGKRLPNVASLWVYPAFLNDRAPNLALNFEPAVSAAECEAGLRAVLATFSGRQFNLLLGTERSMLGRLAGLSRVSLLEPWLCKASGLCLHGSDDLRERIREPRINEVKEKLRELFLYFCYRIFPGRQCPYPLYRLCFTLDYLFEQRKLTLGGEELAAAYGREMLTESELAETDGKRQLLTTWKQMHGLDIFGPPT